jgi:transcriptional regulator with XRE-family HTH domain
MAKTLAPEVRSQFAKRLKIMRVERGFERARYFAKALGIEENRYTRYERAEVEPSLTLIHKMCDVLKVTPNELLGFAADRVGYGPGFAEPADEYGGAKNPPERHLDALAWRLAGEVAAVRTGHRDLADPLALTRETGRVFQQLLKDPFNSIALIVADEAVKDLDPERKASLARLAKGFTEAASRSAG